MKNINHPLLHWIPYKLIEKDNLGYFEWIYLGEREYIDPFFDETISKCKSHPYNSKVVRVISTVENLLDWSVELNSVELKSLVFHVSRCGSTMLSQSLVTSQKNIVISEAPLIDQILQSEIFNYDKKSILIKAVIKLLGQERFPQQKNLIIKLDAWHIFNAIQLRSIFPETPFMLLYRQPAEVLKSHQKMIGMHMVPGLLAPRIFEISTHNIEKIGFKQYGVFVLAKYFQTFLDFYKTDKNVLLCNYNDGMKSVLERFISFVKIEYSNDEVIRMFERLKKYSKNINTVFMGDIFTDQALEADLTQLKILYEKLNSIV